jgi:ATP-binding cassette subfamily B protein
MALLSQSSTLLGLIRQHRDIFRPYRRHILLGALALLLTNLLGIAIPWQIKEAVDGLQRLFAAPSHTLSGPGHALEWQTFYLHLGLIAGLALLTLFTRIASRVFLLGAGRHIEAALRNRVYGHLLGMSASYFAVHPVGELMSRASNDVDATKMIFGGGIMLGLNTILVYILTIPAMLAINAPLAGLTFLFYPLLILAIRRIGRKVREGFGDVQAVLAEISQAAQENLGGMTVIQSYALEAGENKRFAALCDRYRDTYGRLIHQRILMFMTLAALSGLSMALVLLAGGGQVIAHKLDWGGFVAFTLYLEHLAWPTLALGWTISIFQQGTAALQRIDDVLRTESTIPPTLTLPLQGGGDNKTLLKRDITNKTSMESPTGPGRIEIRNLTFAYRNPYAVSDTSTSPESALRPVLQNISLRIEPGETLALVGPVGSGKSTLLRLLPRLYEVPPDTIFLDGRDITRLDPADLRRRLVLMPQSSFLFSTTVRQNIAFGQADEGGFSFSAHTEAESPQAIDTIEMAGVHRDILDAAETAAVHSDIADLPRQYHTLVGERGLMLSGGQRQRVALARTLLTQAEILALDDPFSNVDADTEHRIVNALKARRLLENRTTLIATHRFSVIALCDRVALMDGGRLVAVGTPDELTATQPLYRRLHELQMLRETLGDWDLEPETPPLPGDALDSASVREGV